MKGFRTCFLLGWSLVVWDCHAEPSPSGAAERHRVIVYSDIGGTDPDDYQSMAHLPIEADRIDIEGLIS